MISPATPMSISRLIVMGSHLSPEFGATGGEIERDGFAIAARIECLSAPTPTLAWRRPLVSLP